MVLFNRIVEIFVLSHFGFLGPLRFLFKRLNSWWIRGVPIDFITRGV